MYKCFSSLLLVISIIFISFPCILRGQVIKDSLTNKESSKTIKDTSRAAKADAEDSDTGTASHLELNLTWQSNDVNNGRKDSSVIPLLTPKISYIFKSGFQIDLSVGLNTSSPSPQVNQYTLDGSYTFNSGNYSGTVTVSAFVYSKSSGSTTAEEKGSLEYESSFSSDIVQPSLSLTYTLGTSSPDYAAAVALEHQFTIVNCNITPTATMNAGTQNAYNAYYQNRRFSIPRPGKPPLPENVTLTGNVLNASKFQILDYEFSIPINYTAGKWTFSFTPIEALPVNPADIQVTVTVNNHMHSYTYKESLPNTFYYSFGVTYDF